MHVVVVEGNPTGHRLVYARLIVEAALDLGARATLVIDGAQLSPEDRNVHLGRLDETIAVVDHRIAEVSDLERLSLSTESDVIVVPDGDSLALAFGKFSRWHGRGRVSILVMREQAQPTASPLMDSIKNRLRTTLIKRASRLPAVSVKVLKSAIWNGASEFDVVRDPIVLLANLADVDAVKLRLGLTTDRYWFAVLGAITERKNLPLVAQALHSLDAHSVGLIVAGRMDYDARVGSDPAIAALEQSGCKVVRVDGLLGDVELDSLVYAADCLVLAHSNEGPSGLMGKAAAAGTRLITAGAESLRRDSNLIPDVATWCPLEIVPLSESMQVATMKRRPAPINVAGPLEFTRSLVEA